MKSVLVESSSECIKLLIDVQPNVISEELTPKLVINCSISNNQVQQIDTIKSLSLARYNENIKKFEVLLALEVSTLNLTQYVQFQRSQIGFGNMYISLTLQEPTQSDARVYRCNVTGDDADGINISLVNKKEVKYETISTPVLDEIRRLKKDADKNQCSSTKEEITDKKKQRSKLSFVGSSEVINEFIETFTLTCSCQDSNLHSDTNYTVEFMYIFHETNGVIATINKGQTVVTAIQEVGSNNVKGELSNTKLQESYLQVTWRNLRSSDSGKYFCGAHFIDSDGRAERLNEMVTIKIKLPTFEDLVNVIQKLLIQANDDREILQDNTLNIKSIQKELRNNQDNVIKMYKELDNHEQNFISIKKDLDSNQQNIKIINQDLDNQKQNIIRINTDLDSKEQEFTRFNKDLDSKQQNIIRIDKDLNATKHNITRINKDLDSKQQDIIRIDKDLNSTEHNIKGINKDIDSKQQDIIRIDKDLNSTEHNIIRINKDLDSKQQDIIRIDKDLNATKHNITKINKDLDSKQQDIISLKQDLESTKKDFNEHRQNISMLDTVVYNLSSSLTDVKQKLAKAHIHAAPCRNVRSSDAYVFVLLPSGLKVMCDTKTDGGGWIIFQRRINGKVNFYRGWKEYRDGFGDYDIGEFYLGNENIFNLTSTGQYDLRIDLEFNNTKYFAQYENFKVLSETEKYKLKIGKYSGNAGNNLLSHNNEFFTTYDSDNDKSGVNCAVDRSGAWWYYICHSSNLNGQWGSKLGYKGMNWFDLTGYSDSVSFTEMKIRERE
ncbi:BgiBFREP22.3 [Biomphalaria glabrata]|nr:BgiBFREP22.3 [Biomphalaria glabrata]